MASVCVRERCARKSIATCHCCESPLCREHFLEHDEALKDEPNVLSEQFNLVHNRIVGLKVDDLVAPCRRQLEVWRDDHLQKINEIFKQKCNELKKRAEAKIKKLRKDTEDLHTRLSRSLADRNVDRQTIDSGKADIQNVEQALDTIETMAFRITIKPIKLDQTLIEIEEVNEYHLKLLALGSTYKRISCPEGSYAPIASSDQFLLYHQKPNLCLLNKELEEVKRNAWKNGNIQSMCWSAKLKQFIVIDEHQIFLVNENLKTIERVQITRNRDFYSCTCSNESLFISTYERGSSILEYQLLPEIKFIQEWTSPQTCQQDEWINDISYSGESMAMLIKNQPNKTIRIELINPNGFQRIWRRQIEVQNMEMENFKLCLLVDDGWFAIDCRGHQVLYIAKDGVTKAKQSYNETIRYANMFGTDLLAITTKHGIHFHKF